MRLRPIIAGGLLALVGVLSACTHPRIMDPPMTGYLFTHVTAPYDHNLDNTPVVNNSGAGGIVQIREPISGYGFYTELHTNAIGDIARKHGLKRVYWTDFETYSFLGIWRWQRVHVYGEPETDTGALPEVSR